MPSSGPPAGREKGDAVPTNVVLIVCDTLRADHLGCYGSPWPTSPWLDRVAAEGTRFACARSPHIPTQPAHATLLSGHDVFSHGVVAHGGACEPPDGLHWLPAVLRAGGVSTAAADNIGRWMPRGFDTYESYTLAASADGFWRKSEAVLAAAGRVVPHLAAAARRGRPFFGFFHFWDPHTPYCPPPPFDRLFYAGDERRSDDHGLDALWGFSPFADYCRGWMPGVTDRGFPRAQYAACVRALDQGVQRLWGLLAASGCLEDTLVVVTADHGEELGEHGVWFDHHGLYETNLRVPLLLWAPGRVPRGAVVADAVTLLDVVPTVLGAFGQPARPGLPGRNLLGAWAGGLPPSAPLYCTECTWQKKRAWLEGPFKLISALEPDFHGGPDLELYDLREDAGETANLAAVRPHVVGPLRERLEAHVRRRLVEEGGGADPLCTQPVSSRRIGGVKPPAGARPEAAPAPPAGAAATATVSAADRERVSRRLANLGY